MEFNLAAIAKLIDHAALHPTLTDKQLRKECELAKEKKVASICIKPYAVGLAKEVLEKSGVAIGTVIGFPQGGNALDVKVKEAETACLEGATELDMVVNIGKVLTGDWAYINDEIRTLRKVADDHQALLKIIFENDYLGEDKYKIKLCELCNVNKVDFAKTSTGFGFVKQDNGTCVAKGALDKDLILMRKYCVKQVQIKASGGIKSLKDVLRVVDLGVTRIGTSATGKILSEATALGY
ncbi:deoxyribose-phosphate aldolase [bacterium]|jgi:deoxyribose-phosphate aldolase|nr:deoxyribose-phosphate aldolase [bacterium]MBT3580677.1 deoxyribose-phosphate aldolase [bacterium]MBT4552212.1 deoxyribose-phosphate aldolase [bacterium]MBT5988778.1 deoxyribose-phosphate aldolase [bacterium]MBT7087896.1 deoxyribose-phosphate aldolase [bacterium]